MTLFTFGINHTTASLALREQLAIVPERLQACLQDARANLGLSELVILSTCNRTELYGHAAPAPPDKNTIAGWFETFQGVESQAVAAAGYEYLGDEALKHMMRVATGLDSMVLGEPQVFGQMKTAFADARNYSALASNSQLIGVFEQVFAVAKRVRTDTAIGANPVSVASAAVRLARQIFTELSDNRVLLIGAGETIALVGKHLREQGIRRIDIANRSLERGQALATELGGEAILLSDIPQRLQHADIVISSTASQLPIVGKGMVEQALQARKRRQMLLLDLAVPRDIEAQVGDLDNAYLYSVDDLSDIVDSNRRGRANEAARAEEIIEQAVNQFVLQQRQQPAIDRVKAYRQQAQVLQQQEVARALAALQSGQRPEQVVAMLAKALTNKLIHTPSVQLKEAATDGDDARLRWAETLLGISDTASTRAKAPAPIKASGSGRGSNDKEPTGD